MEMNIRTLRVSDQNSWLELWEGYLKFYEVEIPDEQTNLTWSRLLDENFNMHGLVAELEGEVVGLAHYSFTNSSWAVAPNLFLEDLFVAKKARGQGVGKKLILALDEPAKSMGSEKVYWETRKDNAVARLLYDGVAELSEFVTYNRSLN
jgi:GNAT superfamily N-acetyltransferase